MQVQDYLSKEEIKALTQKSDLKALFELGKTWGTILFTFLVVAWYPSVFTIVPALFILGGKQLACAIIMHDASHRALFRANAVNDWVGNWLGGYWVFSDTQRYRPYHLKHHVNTGTHKDPDLSLTRGYPTTIKSFVRKILRDLAGITGFKTQVGLFYINFGLVEFTAAGVLKKINQTGRSLGQFILTGLRNYAGPLAVHALLLGVLWAFGVAWLFALWVGALLSTYNFSLRIRSMAEHSMVPEPLDNHRNTRTTYARWWEKLLFAPHHVNYHAEHHLLMTVPPYHLPKMHQLLKTRGFYEEGILAQNYVQLIRQAMSGRPRAEKRH
ncbi:MAG: fatty acid desaturase family protein [Microscillaceae bacterium]|nr:fatty acid desaturase family protein [Microscillaceae bacterium]